MGIKLIALDLDDTLLDPGLKISPACVRAIREAREQGVMVTISTGRMFRSALPYAHQLQIDIPLITYQGAWVKNSFSGEAIYYRPVPPKFAREVIQFYRDEKIHFQTYYDDQLCMENFSEEGKYYSRLVGIEPVMMDDLASGLQLHDAMKITAVSFDHVRLAHLQAILQERYKESLFITTSKPHFLEIMDREATKAKALEVVAGHFGIKREEVMAIGDSYNDLAMVEWAGVGVAMGNAVSAVKAAADFVTTSNEEEGVAEAIRRLVLEAEK